MPRSTRWLAGFAVLMAAASASAGGTGRIVEVRYPPSEEPGELAYGVTFRAWIPGGAGRLRGVIVHQHGCGVGACKGGETAADDLHWQALAAKWDCALLGPSYEQPDGADCQLWSDPSKGSRARFLRSLEDLGARSGHPELAEVPWCLWGHSGGGWWAGRMMRSDPERIVAAWLRSGAPPVGEGVEIPGSTYQIPVMCNPGARERDDQRFHGAWDGTMALFRAHRAEGAPAGFAPDPNSSHDCGGSRYLAIPFFDACLAARLPEPGSEDPALRPIDPADGWLAPVLGDRAVPASEYEGDPSAAVWLPDGRVADAWEQYVSTGFVADDTPPPSPTDLEAVATDDGVALTWSAVADLESGLRQFVVERDGRAIGRVPESPSDPEGRPLFQGLSYHDTPEPAPPALRFVDPDPPADRSASYRVIAVNGAGLESSPSVPAATR